MALTHPDHDDRSTFYPLGAEWTHPDTGAVFKVIKTPDGLFAWDMIKPPKGDKP